MPFQTTRLILREATFADQQFIFDLLTSPTWLKYIGDRGISNLEDAKDYIQKSLLDSYQKNAYGLWIMEHKADQQPIGLCGFLKRYYLAHPDIGYSILASYEGRGLTTEAATACLQYAKKQLGFTTVLAITSNNNLGSQKVLEKIGMKNVGTIQAPHSDEPLLKFKIDAL